MWLGGGEPGIEGIFTHLEPGVGGRPAFGIEPFESRVKVGPFESRVKVGPFESRVKVGPFESRLQAGYPKGH
jgi:hypothetical protein